MPTIFAQVQGNAVGAGFFCQQGCLNRIWINGSTRISNGCDMVNIDAKVNDGCMGM
jgi:hypothetical protein